MTIHLRRFALTTLALALILAAFLASPARAQDTGSADFTRFVALGDSLGAGFVSGGLVVGAQEDSVPALVARQASGTVIEQPLVSEPGIPPLLQLQSLSPLVVRPLPGLGQPLNLNLPRPYDNLSVPGFRLGDALRNRARPGNDLASLILRTPNTQLEQALALQPTFALIWLGNNDVLAAATSGRVIEGVTLTPVARFESDFRALVGALRGAGANLVFANLPDVTSIPFVTTVPPFIVIPGGQQVPLIGPNGPLGPADRVLLTATAKLAQGIGVPAALGGTGQPLADSDVLSAAEVDAIQARVNAFNGIISAVASETGSALADVNGLLRDLATRGINIGGITFTEAFVTGGSFSLDGVHPAPLGYAVAANEFIRAINETYGGDIPPVDLFPFVFGPDASAIPSIPGAIASEVIFSPAAARQLEDVLRVWQPAAPPEDDGGTKPAKRPDGILDVLPSRPRG